MSLLDISSLFSATDEQLMWRVRSEDDQDAFSRLVSKWQPAIQRLCVRMVGDIHRGEDLAQEAFAKLYAKRLDYLPSARFSTYLWRIALNNCYDELRRLKRRPEMSLEAHGGGDGESFSLLDGHITVEATPETDLHLRERAEMVCAALQKLPDHVRTVVVLRHYENLKFREIAEVLEIPEGTAKSRMAEGLQQLSQILMRAMRADSEPRAFSRHKESLIL